MPYVYAFAQSGYGLTFDIYPGTQNVTAVRAYNTSNEDRELVVIQQYSLSDPALPGSGPYAGGAEVILFGPEEVAAGDYAEFNVTAYGFVMDADSVYYGDEFSTASGSGTAPAGGEVIPDLRIA